MYIYVHIDLETMEDDFNLKLPKLHKGAVYSIQIVPSCGL